MRKIPKWGRPGAALLLASVVAAGTTLAGLPSPASADPADTPENIKSAPADTLDSHDADLLAQAKAKGEQHVVLIVATDKGDAKDVAAEITDLGGNVAKRYDSIGYVRARVPIGSVEQAAKLPGVAAIDLNESIPLPDPTVDAKADAKGAKAHAVAGPGPDTPAANPFMPTNETGAVKFKQQHPTWDGRGVTIGILDAGVDLDNPALRTTSTGERKIVDWFTATDPIFDGDGTWRAMLTTVTGRPSRSPAPRGRRRQVLTPSTGSARRSPRAATPPAMSTATATPPTSSACFTTRRATTSASTPTRTSTSPTTP